MARRDADVGANGDRRAVRCLKWVALAAAGLGGALPARAETPPACLPLPKDYQVSLAIQGGSAVSLAEALACLMGVVATRAPGVRDVPLTVSTSSPVPLAVAVTHVDRIASQEGVRFKREHKALRLACVRGRSCGASSPVERLVRVVLRAPERLAIVTTEAAAPSRHVLDDPAAVVRVAPDYYRLSEDIRDLARLDPMAFVSEGAAWPNLLGLPETGFFITWLRPGGFFERVGLRVADLVTEVNGFRLRSISDAFAAYGALQDARVLVVRVRRGTSSLVMIYEFATPSSGRSGPHEHGAGKWPE